MCPCASLRFVAPTQRYVETPLRLRTQLHSKLYYFKHFKLYISKFRYRDRLIVSLGIIYVCILVIVNILLCNTYKLLIEHFKTSI